MSAEKNVVESALEAGGKLVQIQQVPLDEKRITTKVLVPNGFSIETVNSDLLKPPRKGGDTLVPKRSEIFGREWPHC